MNAESLIEKPFLHRWGPLAVLCLLVLGAGVHAFQDPQPPAAASAKLPFKEVLSVPDGTPEEKLEFFQQLRQKRPNFNSEAEAIEHVKRVYETIAAATGKLLTEKLTPEQLEQVTSQHFQSLVILNRARDPRAEGPMLAMAEKLKDSKEKQLAEFARVQLIQANLDATMESKPGAAARLLAELKDYAGAGRPSGEKFQTMRTVARVLEMSGDYKGALEAYDLMGATFHKGGNLELLSAAEDSAKAARTRIGTIGKKVAFEFTSVDGKPFDFVSQKGKVVLIDFWATWCGPCRAELPNVKKNYEKYHDRGFEVLGISIDEDRSALESFLKEAELPWPILFSDDAKTTQALADRYGVEGIPHMMLVGRDGKVITLKARGEDLAKELEKLLGPVDEKGEDKK